MTGREKFNKLRYIIKITKFLFSILPKSTRTSFLVAFRNIPGGIGIILRYAILSTISKIGENVTIMGTVILKNPEKFSCGNNVSIHSMCYFEASGGITIGNDVSIAHGVTILSETHTYFDNKIAIKYQPMIYKPTHIGNNVWIGAKATILCGLTIADGTIIGANSVVTHNTHIDSINVGIPSKFLKSRVL